MYHIDMQWLYFWLLYHLDEKWYVYHPHKVTSKKLDG